MPVYPSPDCTGTPFDTVNSANENTKVKGYFYDD
ncbi:hypothetical protein EV192_104199 [Actinocrispum wychmicini]|uniref:Uncharacterized protein n=1 Tax=Actinocrispum wychmicini TaxID=1213861 RepID=A0A4R2JQA6_9PSEU|nr:hypothetical protein EV192_104199 [Actinocrispum wychmicini]